MRMYLSIELMEHAKKEFIIDPVSINRLLSKLPDTVKTTFDVAHVPLHKDLYDYFSKTQRINKIHLKNQFCTCEASFL